MYFFQSCDLELHKYMFQVTCVDKCTCQFRLGTYAFFIMYIVVYKYVLYKNNMIKGLN